MIQRTYCRICESNCGLLATVEAGSVVSLAPDPDHPVSRGYACAKGTRFHRLATGENRLQEPRIDGRAAGWEAALGAVAQRLRAIREARGADAIACFSGTAAGQSIGAISGVLRLLHAVGSKRHYSALTLDNAPQVVVADAVFGSPLQFFCADYPRSDLLVLVGTDPLASQASQGQFHGGAGAEIRAAGRRGGLVVVDPRRSSTAAHGTHLAPLPGTDVAWLSWLVGELIAGGRSAVPAGRLVELPRRDVAEVARITGVAAEEWLGVRDRLLAAERPLVWSGLGVLLGPDGTLGWWLTVVANALLGAIDRPGGWIRPPVPVHLESWARYLGIRALDPTPDGIPSVLGTRAAAAFPGDVARGDVRALVVVGGNPAASLPDQRAARDALRKLDLLVVVDPFDSATARLAHAALPAATWLERADVGLHTASGTPGGLVRSTPAVTPPIGQAREDWDILDSLARRVGARSPAPHPVWAIEKLLPLVASRDRYGFRARSGRVPRLRIRLDPPPFCDALAAWRPPSDDDARRFLLVTSDRPIGRMTSWIGDNTPVARLNPADLAREGLHDGDVVRVEGPAGSLELPVRGDADVRAGVVVVAFGSDHGPNAVISGAELDRFAGQPRSNGTRVAVRKG